MMCTHNAAFGSQSIAHAVLLRDGIGHDALVGVGATDDKTTCDSARVSPCRRWPLHRRAPHGEPGALRWEVTVRSPITTKSAARSLCTALVTRASLLRLPGHNRLGTEERKRIADDLDAAAGLIRRLMGEAQSLPDIAAVDQTADDDATEADLFGGAA